MEVKDRGCTTVSVVGSSWREVLLSAGSRRKLTLVSVGMIRAGRVLMNFGALSTFFGRRKGQWQVIWHFILYNMFHFYLEAPALHAEYPTQTVYFPVLIVVCR